MWEWAWSILHKMRTRRSHPGPWAAPQWKQAILEEELPRQLAKFKAIWCLLKGTCLWTIWIQRNAMVFDEQVWSDSQSTEIAWLTMLDYGKIAWQNTLKKIEKHPELENALLKSFDRSWLSRKVFGNRKELQVYWRKRPPHRSFIIQPVEDP